MPASRTNCGLLVERPATPMTSARLLTRPSLTPKMMARRVPGATRPVPASRGGDVRGCVRAGRWRRRRVVGSTPDDRPAVVGPSRRNAVQIRACSRSSAAMAATSGDRTARSYSLLLVALERQHEVGDGTRAEPSRDQHDEPDPDPRSAPAAGTVAPELGQLRAPRCRRVAARWRRSVRTRRHGLASFSIAGERLVQQDRVALELEVLEARRDVDRGHTPRW